MDLIKQASRRNLFSETLYIVLNIGLAAAILALVNAFQPPYLAAIVFLLSKWRIFGVRPRFWFAHLQSNLVDIVVGLSFVALLYRGQGEFILQIALTVLYVGWLLVLKPRSHKRDMVLQAGVSQFVGLTALALFSHFLPSSIFVIAVAIITYGAARHVLTAYSEDNATLVAFGYAFLLAELGWFYYHWMVAYQTLARVAIPQLAIVALLIGFTAYQLYMAYRHSGRVTFKDVRLPATVLVGMLVVLMLFFTRWSFIS